MGMILFISVLLLLFDFLLKDELQQDQWHEEDEFILGVARAILQRHHPLPKETRAGPDSVDRHWCPSHEQK
jgi:hypothetical protein